MGISRELTAKLPTSVVQDEIYKEAQHNSLFIHILLSASCPGRFSRHMRCWMRSSYGRAWWRREESVPLPAIESQSFSPFSVTVMTKLPDSNLGRVIGIGDLLFLRFLQFLHTNGVNKLS
jgi:hypothetical protein